MADSDRDRFLCSPSVTYGWHYCIPCWIHQSHNQTWTGVLIYLACLGEMLAVPLQQTELASEVTPRGCDAPPRVFSSCVLRLLLALCLPLLVFGFLLLPSVNKKADSPQEGLRLHLLVECLRRSWRFPHGYPLLCQRPCTLTRGFLVNLFGHW